MTLTPELLKKCMPNASLTNCTFAAPHLEKAMAHYKINTLERRAAFLAQLAHESGSLRYMAEIANGLAYEGRKDLGNTSPGDGVKFKGHGYIQVTGKANHQEAMEEFGKASLEETALWLQTHAGASWSAAWFWFKTGLNTIADKTDMWRGDRGKKFKGLDKFTYICVSVNGGLNGIVDRRDHYARIRKALGI